MYYRYDLLGCLQVGIVKDFSQILYQAYSFIISGAHPSSPSLSFLLFSIQHFIVLLSISLEKKKKESGWTMHPVPCLSPSEGSKSSVCWIWAHLVYLIIHSLFSDCPGVSHVPPYVVPVVLRTRVRAHEGAQASLSPPAPGGPKRDPRSQRPQPLKNGTSDHPGKLGPGLHSERDVLTRGFSAFQRH